MKKVGLITFHDTTNFGSFFQTYALYTVVNELGNECTVIDNKCEAIEKRELPNNRPQNIAIRSLAKFVVHDIKIKRKYEMFKVESDRRLKKTKCFYKNNIKESNAEFDIFMCGSDILWDLNLVENDTSYMLDFVEDQKVKLAFSTSIGNEWKDANLEKAVSLIKKFDHVALREKESAEWLKKIINKDVLSVCDPTMLLESKKWREYASESEYKISKKRYILVYFPNKKIISDAISYARNNAMEVWVINYGRWYAGVKNIAVYRPADFLKLIECASLVMTGSYHGTLFALYFNVPYYAYLSGNGHDVRFVDLLRKVKQVDRICTDTSKMSINTEVDFYESNCIINEWREESRNILETFIN